jgi:glutathione S-transferase
MLKLYHARRTRSARILWLLEELGAIYEVETCEFIRPESPFSQRTPSGKFPVLEDGEVVIFESGAILEYLLETRGDGRFAPGIGSPLRGVFLQWVHFAEATLMPPLSEMIRHTVFLPEENRVASVIADARQRAGVTLGVLERALEGQDYLLGNDFSGADIMMGCTLQYADWFGLLVEFPHIQRYFGRLKERPAFKRAFDT